MPPIWAAFSFEKCYNDFRYRYRQELCAAYGSFDAYLMFERLDDLYGELGGKQVWGSKDDFAEKVFVEADWLERFKPSPQIPSDISIDIEAISPLLKTEPNTAFFWSGNTNGIGGKDRAFEIAKSKGGTTLEGIIAEQAIDMPEWDFDVPDSILAWESASMEYAKQVSGDVYAIIGKNLRPGNVWEKIELPNLIANPNVSRIIIVDPDTLAETIIFTR